MLRDDSNGGSIPKPGRIPVPETATCCGAGSCNSQEQGDGRAPRSTLRPRLLDLFCGAGGAAVGYHRAGFDVVGVDIKPQPNYPFEFWQEDALEVAADVAERMRGGFTGGGPFDAVHASPPCQAFTDLKSMWNARDDHPDLIGPTRELLHKTGLPYVIENVEGAPLESPVVICGSSLALKVRRHRLFETNWPLMVPPCAHGQQGVPVGVYGTGGGGQMTRGYKARGVEEAREVMGTPWMTLAECSQAIPPAYTEFIGEQLLSYLRSGQTEDVLHGERM